MPRDRSNSPPPPLDGSAYALDRERRGAKGSLDDAHRLMMRIGVLLGFVTAAAGFRGLLPAVGPHVDWSCSRARANQGRCIHFVISPVMANTCLPPSSSRLMIHRHSSVASRPRNARGMLRRASGRAERDGARGEASTPSEKNMCIDHTIRCDHTISKKWTFVHTEISFHHTINI